MPNKTILITGCSSGIGFDASTTLHQQGYHVIACCRKLSDVERLMQLGLDAVQMDVSNTQSIHNAFEEVLKKSSQRIDVLINNAGYGQAGALEDISYETMVEQFATNVFGLMELTRLVIPIMRRQQQGRIINISSLLGFVSMPFRGAYNASKYAVEGISDTLRIELKPSGIDVITIEPGPITSQFRNSAIDHSLQKIDVKHSYFKSQYKNMLLSFRRQKDESIFTKNPNAVTKKIIRAIESKKPRPKYRVTFPTHLFAILKRCLSVKMLDRLITFVSKYEMSSK